VSEHQGRLRASAAMKAALWLVVLTAVAIAHSACASSTARGRPETPIPAPSPAPPPPQPPAPTDGDDGPPPGAPPPGGPIGTRGNHRIRGFDEAKRELVRIYAAAGRRTDLYCGCTFLGAPGRAMRVDLSGCGYVPARDAARAERIEWEHAVPASAFGHTFSAWRDGDARCVDTRGRPFHGRKCARVASAEFARIEADLHNLFPVVGEVNGLRGDLPMGVLDPPGRAYAHAGGGSSFTFGACQSAIDHGVFLPRREVRGDLARAYKYMNESYPERSLIDDAHRPIFDAWDREDPPDAWERERNGRIEARQGNANDFIGP
jgi:deoxyribonuclease I